MITEILDAFKGYVEGFRAIAKYRLWGYFAAPAIISILLGAIIFTTALGIADNIGEWLLSYYPWDWGRATLLKVANVFGGLFVGAFGLIIFKQLVIALSAPFMSMLSEQIEKKMIGRQGQGFSVSKMLSDLVRGIRIALRNITRELFFTLMLFLLGLIPVFSPFTTLAIFLVQAYYAGFGNMDFTLERHTNVRQSVRFVRQHKGLAIGNGTVFLLILMTVVGFVVVLPLSTAAAAVETLKRLEVRV
ncbi:MAG: EI24 domain-containing protein [Saprospiraceae bacterium]